MSVLSDKVVTISKPFLGPATESFLSRQCKSHLKIELNELNTTHLKDLAKWVEIGAGLLMEPSKASDLAKKIASP
jgi:hypothetical protein